MNEAKFLNNKAILYLKKGDAFEACNVLTEASSICLAEFSQMAGVKRKSSSVIQWVNVANQNSQNDSNDNSHHGLYHYAPAFDNVCACSHRRRSNSNTITSQPSGGEGEAPQQQPTIIPNTTTTTTTNSCSSNSTSTSSTGKKRCRQCNKDDAAACPCNVAPIVWYNLALTCQMLGGELGGKATKDGAFYLTRSIYWYEKVLNLWKSTSEPNTLIMAILNNVACIYLDSGRQYEYKMSMLRLKKSLHNRSRPWTSGAVHNQWRIFHMNLSLMNNPRPAAAA